MAHRSNRNTDILHDEGRPASRRETLAAVLVIVCLLLFRTPSPEYVLTDPDGGVQLAAAAQILHFDEHPWIDFAVAYGPLPYYLSTAFQWVSNDRLIGELFLDVLGYLVALLMLFRASHRLANHPAVAWLAFLSILVLLPRFFKYFILLAPAAILSATFFYVENPRRARAVIVGIALGCAFLARFDLGIVGVAAVAITTVTVPAVARRTRHIHLAIMAAVCGLVIVPWLAFVVARGGSLFGLARDILATLTSVPVGLALPHPLLSWHDPLLTATYFGFFGLAGATTVLVAVRWRSLPLKWRSRMATTVVMAAGSLLLASHRSDLSHMIQATPMVLVLGSGLGVLLFAPGGESSNRRRALIPSAALATTTLIAVWAITQTAPSNPVRFGSFDPRQIVRTYRLAAQPLPELVSTIGHQIPEFWPLEIIDQVQQYSSADDRVCIWPWYSQLLYFAGRGFAGRTPYLLPGHLDTPGAQLRIVAELRSNPPSMVLWDEDYYLDGRLERNPALTHSLVHAEVLSTMVRSGKVGRLSVYLRPGLRTIESAGESHEQER
jgi:hypothetical protein